MLLGLISLRLWLGSIVAPVLHCHKFQMVMMMVFTWLTSTLWSSACFLGAEHLQP